MDHSPAFLALVEQARPNIRECDIHHLKSIMDQNTPLILIDVREESEYALDHLPSAIHLSKGLIERDIEMKFPDKDQELYLYCGGGFRSILAAHNLQLMGYSNIISVDGGIRAWREAAYPLSK